MNLVVAGFCLEARSAVWYISPKKTRVATGHMERCSTLLVLRKMQIKDPQNGLHQRIRMINAGRSRKKRELSYTVGGNVNRCLWRLLKKTKNRTSLVVHLPMEGTRVQYLAEELSQTLQPHPPAPKESDDEWHLSKENGDQSSK